MSAKYIPPADPRAAKISLVTQSIKDILNKHIKGKAKLDAAMNELLPVISPLFGVSKDTKGATVMTEVASLNKNIRPKVL